MTSDELRKVDAEVAEKVMGWTDISALGCGYPPSGPIGPNERRPPHTAPRLGTSRVPPYSTDPAAAWSVVEKLVSMGRKVHVETCFAGGKLHNDVTVSGTVEDLDSHADADEPTMPEAVCRAALAALPAPAQDGR